MTMEEIIAQEDPRENVNVVFIGHVDAGKSTICGSIMYITGMVDKRTIEKFEREAKVRNRESWFLAYIMDTNEEERAKVGFVFLSFIHSFIQSIITYSFTHSLSISVSFHRVLPSKSVVLISRPSTSVSLFSMPLVTRTMFLT